MVCVEKEMWRLAWGWTQGGKQAIDVRRLNLDFKRCETRGYSGVFPGKELFAFLKDHLGPPFMLLDGNESVSKQEGMGEASYGDVLPSPCVGACFSASALFFTFQVLFN